MHVCPVAGDRDGKTWDKYNELYITTLLDPEHGLQSEGISNERNTLESPRFGYKYKQQK